MGTNFPLPPPSAVVEPILAAARGLEFRTFVVGFTRPRHYSREEHEALFRALKIAAGDRLLELWPGRDVDFRHPQVRFDVRHDLAVDIQIAPLFLAGRYRKLSREIPGSRWIHHRCRGRGCPACRHTGNTCGPSVQELVSGPVLAATGGESTLFHSLGREDTDARMLGRGRPFVLEVFRPLRRSLEIGPLATRINQGAAGLAEIHRLSPVEREAARAVKAAAAEKSYRALVEADLIPPHDSESRAAALSGREIRQLSPTRVAARRGWDTLRLKRVIEARWLGPCGERYLFEVRAEAGTYVKELISGDRGRTVPSLSEVLGVPCRCASLDVLEVHWDPPWEN